MTQDTIDMLMSIETEDERVIAALRAAVDELERYKAFAEAVSRYNETEKEIFRKIGYVHVGCENCANNCPASYMCENCEANSNYSPAEVIV